MTRRSFPQQPRDPGSKSHRCGSNDGGALGEGPHAEDAWQKVASCLDLLLLTIVQLVAQLSVAMPAEGEPAREPRGPLEQPPVAAVPITGTGRSSAAISSVEAVARPTATILCALRDDEKGVPPPTVYEGAAC
ncbi:unnamed protein product [Lampetra planeri]